MGDRSRTFGDQDALEQSDAHAPQPEATRGSGAAGSSEPPADLWNSAVPYRELIEQVRDYAIFCTDVAGRATTWNRGVARVLGYDEDEFLGIEISDIFTPEDVANGVPQWEMQEAEQRGSANDNRWMLKRDGNRFYCIGMTTALRDDQGKLIGFAKVMQDRTLQHRQSEELQQKTRELARANSEKDRFLAVLSHELRNPLASIRNAVDVLRLEPSGARSADRALGMIDRQSRQLSYLVDELLDLSRVGRGRMALSREPVRLDRLAREVGEDQRPAFEKSGVELTLSIEDAPLVVFADRVRVRQIIGNLLDNARKFTPHGSVVLAVRPVGEHALMEVSDTGVGVEPEALAGLFELFAQADRQPSQLGGGLGLGLALVKGLVDLHGGQVEAHSEGLNRGMTVSVRLPLCDAELAPEAQQAAATEHVARKILIIDDDADAAETLSAALVMRGHRVETARAGGEGIDRAISTVPEVILCDIGLPDIDGFEVARRLNARFGAGGPLLIALRGREQPLDDEKVRDAGFAGHYVKPPDLGALDRLISSLQRLDG